MRATTYAERGHDVSTLDYLKLAAIGASVGTALWSAVPTVDQKAVETKRAEQQWRMIKFCLDCGGETKINWMGDFDGCTIPAHTKKDPACGGVVGPLKGQ